MSTRGVIVLRPEPGNARTAARLEAAGITVRRCPLFAVHPVAWTAPDPAQYDALLLTSANAVRHAGSELHRLRALPVCAVGTTTAAAAREAGFGVALIGNSDGAGIARAAHKAGFGRLLHLAGRDRRAVAADAITVYASTIVPVARAVVRKWAGQLLLLHSIRAAVRCAELVDDCPLDRNDLTIAALSSGVARAAGEGWREIACADRPDDTSLVGLARASIAAVD